MSVYVPLPAFGSVDPLLAHVTDAEHCSATCPGRDLLCSRLVGHPAPHVASDAVHVLKAWIDGPVLPDPCAVACPRCEQPAYSRCRVPRTGRTTDTHAARIAAFYDRPRGRG